MSEPPPAGQEDAQIADLVAWFDDQGRTLVFHELPDGRWIAFYPNYGQSINSAPNEEGPSKLEAALAAKTALEQQAAT